MEKDDRRGGIYKGEALNSACKWSGPNPTLLNNEQVIPLRHGLLPVHIYIYIYIYI
jgi:hypothetical protein